MTDGLSAVVARQAGASGRWTSFVGNQPPAGRSMRALHEEGRPEHRVRVEHDRHTLLVHISDEDGGGWTTVAIDRPTREWSVAQRDTQRDAATAAHSALYEVRTCGGCVPGAAPDW